MRKRLIGLRKGAGYTQQTFSDKLGISRSHYAQIESGEKNPSLKLSLKIKGALNYEYDDIFLTQNDPFRVTIRNKRPRKERTCFVLVIIFYPERRER